MAESKAQSLLNRVSNVNVAGLPVGDVVGIVSDEFKRRPNVKAWAKAKRQERRRLKAQRIQNKKHNHDFCSRNSLGYLFRPRMLAYFLMQKGKSRPNSTI